MAVTSILSQLTLLSSPPTQKSKKKRASGNFPASPHWSAGDAEEESGSGSIWDNNGDLEDEDGSTGGGGGGGGGGVLGSNMHSRKYEERGEEHDILNEICLMDGSGNGASSSSSGSGSGNKGSPHPHPHPHGTKNNGYSLNGGAKNDTDLNTPSHNASSSPNKVGGSSAGNVICVTEICCDEIEVNEKVTKVAHELNNLSFLADCVSEIPASGSI